MLFLEQQEMPFSDSEWAFFSAFFISFSRIGAIIAVWWSFYFWWSSMFEVLKLELPLVKAFFLPLSVQSLQVITFLEVSY